MSLDVSLYAIRPQEVACVNVTHNLVPMAEAAGLYRIMWHPDSFPIETARQMIPHLQQGIDYMRAHQDALQKLNPENGWGSYDTLLGAALSLLRACEENPSATVVASR